MRLSLNCHSGSPSEASIHIEVEAVRSGRAELALRYLVSGAIADLRLPPPVAPVRADGLWQHTCFEAFIRGSTGEAYYEINLAPSGQWAAYRFTDYRNGMEAATLPGPWIETQLANDSFELRTTLDLQLWDLPLEGPWHLNLSAVIEETSGAKSYWALAHPSGKADFHHPDCFTHQLSGPSDR